MSYINYLKDHGKEDFKLAAKESIRDYAWTVPVTLTLEFLIITFLGYRESK